MIYDFRQMNSHTSPAMALMPLAKGLSDEVDF
jgi:hypothetical protein